jgi:hypothetical protein
MIWSRERTREWLSAIEDSVEDYEYYLRRTLEWCENNNAWSEGKVTACCIMTIIWVSTLRGEEITLRSVLEILGSDDYDLASDDIVELGPEVHSMDLEEILTECMDKFQDSTD